MIDITQPVVATLEVAASVPATVELSSRESLTVTDRTAWGTLSQTRREVAAASLGYKPVAYAPTSGASEFTSWLRGKVESGKSVELPAGTFTLTQPVKVSNRGVTIAGAGAINTTILCTSTTGAFRFWDGSEYSSLRDLYLVGPGRSASGSYGIGWGNDPTRPGAGAVTRGLLMEGVIAENFDDVMRLGTEEGCCVDGSLINRCNLSNGNRLAYLTGGGNTLNITFRNCYFYSANNGLFVKSASNIWIEGGGATAVGHRTGTDPTQWGATLRSEWGGMYGIKAFRHEDSPSGYAIVNASGGPSAALLDSVETGISFDATGQERHMSLIAGTGTVELRNCISYDAGLCRAATNAVYNGSAVIATLCRIHPTMTPVVKTGSGTLSTDVRLCHRITADGSVGDLVTVAATL